MTDDKLAVVKDTVEAVAVIVENVPVYPDAIQPAAKELGRTLALPLELLNTALRPVKTALNAANFYFDGLDARLQERLKHVPAEKIVEPPTSVAGPLLFAYPFVQEEPSLREMFEQLLATAMTADTRLDAHPSFVEIVRQLTSDEAGLLRALHADAEKYTPIGRIDLRLDTRSYRPLGLCTSLSRQIAAEAAPRVPRYIGNFERLGLLKMQFLEPVSNRDVDYVALEAEAIQFCPTENLPVGASISLKRGALTCTDFGAAFLRACIGPVGR